jgi:hypothetical protein
MPTAIRVSAGAPAQIGYNAPLIRFYLHTAREAAVAALALGHGSENFEARLEQSIQTVLWATLSLESGANSLAERLVAPRQREDFIRCKGVYKRRGRISETVWKWQKLFSDGLGATIHPADEIWAAAEALVQTRDTLWNHVPEETAQRLGFNLEGPVILNSDMRPFAVAPSVLEALVLGSKPKQHFNAARDIFRKWELESDFDLSEFDKAVPAL